MPPLRRRRPAPRTRWSCFAAWYERAAEREVPLAEAVCLATVDADGLPDARMVLLKGFGPEGFRFFTNEGSAKGAQLEAAPGAALVFFWRELDRQVRVRGPVERVGADEADEYFASRGRGEPDRRLGEPAEPAAGRARRARPAASTRSRSASGNRRGRTRPPHWGGYRVVPLAIEFWQGQVAPPPRPLPLLARSAPGEPWSLHPPGALIGAVSG